MNFSVWRRLRKWPCGRLICDQRPIAALALVLAILICAGPAQANLTARGVPLPKPRPTEAPLPPQPDQPAASERPAAEKPAAEAKPPELSACRLALTDAIAIAPSVPDIKGPGACGGPDMVHLEAVVLPDRTRVPLKPGGTMRCSMASAVADWIRTDMAPMAAALGTRLVELDNFDSFDCRGRNRVVGAKMSEHGRANALDIRGLKLGNGQSIALTERGTPRELREKVLMSICTRFSTVLGPGSDGYHEDHIHLDLAERRGNYKICQWSVWDQLPAIAPLMPAERPAEAPPRESAADQSAAERPPETAPAEQPAAAASAAEAEPQAVEPAPPPVKPKAKPKPRKRHAAPSSFPFPFPVVR
ncbi:extensin family protein [Tardiphaga sp.]|uniref:extensin family protein n=1 Tax=Tardiphaga sp. TaxID=1926292 RepID=UPI00262045A1|nr:extensin family protein [Tardiphaga sp.]MDB5617604.1 Extensin-like [Tardiphaga sp.]